ncbi:MAG: hypothetical protein HRU20_09360 [Pseudomonadales bacterium]|nr:hypothetical protein [Pseudomonadales bacterium]
MKNIVKQAIAREMGTYIGEIVREDYASQILVLLASSFKKAVKHKKQLRYTVLGM